MPKVDIFGPSVRVLVLVAKLEFFLDGRKVAWSEISPSKANLSSAIRWAPFLLFDHTLIFDGKLLLIDNSGGCIHQHVPKRACVHKHFVSAQQFATKTSMTFILCVNLW